MFMFKYRAGVQVHSVVSVCPPLLKQRTRVVSSLCPHEVIYEVRTDMTERTVVCGFYHCCGGLLFSDRLKERGGVEGASVTV